tara:strand:+ start:284 stop:1039 length:756 start_codon:yes stop_codon:yes gene_type:complete
MKKPPTLYYTQNPSEITHADLVYKYQDLASSFPSQLTPSDQPDKWQSKSYYSQAPMDLSAGEWTVHNRLTFSTNSLKVFGRGYHTVMKMSKTNTAGLLYITGHSVVISDMRFVANPYPTISSGKLIEIASGVNNVKIRNCGFDCTRGEYAIYADGATNLTIEDCYFTPGSNDVIYMLDCNNAVVRNNKITAGAGVEINLASTGAGTVSTQSNFGIVLGNHVGTGTIRYNTTATSGNHQISGNNANATLTTY